MLWGSPIELSNQAQLKNRIKESLLKNRRILSAYNLTERDLSKHVRFLERYKPEYLYGYATILTVFAKMLDDANIKPQLSLKAVVSTSETLEKWQEDLIARVFDCPVANEYGARDAGILAYTCPSGGIHITAENCIIEVLDPVTYEPVLNGQSGVLAITDLTNYVQPRLRYMLGDMGTLSTEECCCGRRLPLVPIIEKELLQRREEQMQNQKLYRKSYDTNYLDFVFVNDMGTLFIPFTVTMIPNYLLISKIGLRDRIWGVALPQLADVLGIFLLRQAMRGIPLALIEAARMENIRHMKIMRDIVIPLVRPSIISTGIIFFINSWNEYVWPVLILKSKENYTLSLALQMYISAEGGTEFTIAMAVSVLTMLIPLVLYIIFQRYIINTFAASGVKG